MKKRLIAFGLTACMLCSTACSSSLPDDGSAAQSATTTTTTTNTTTATTTNTTTTTTTTTTATNTTTTNTTTTTTTNTTTTTSAFTPIYSTKDYFETLEFYDGVTEQTIDYLFHEPRRHIDEPVPLVVYLHGLGEAVTAARPGSATSMACSLMAFENRSPEYSAYTLVPCTPSEIEGFWTHSQVAAFKTLLRDIIARYNIDQNRIYISGFSMGGFMTCQLVSEMPNVFAAAIPLSGTINLSSPSLSHGTAFRIYHSAADEVVDVSCSRSLYQQLLNSNHPNVEYVEFPEGSHVFPVYCVFEHTREEFFTWLFNQRLHSR